MPVVILRQERLCRAQEPDPGVYVYLVRLAFFAVDGYLFLTDDLERHPVKSVFVVHEIGRLLFFTRLKEFPYILSHRKLVYYVALIIEYLFPVFFLKQVLYFTLDPAFIVVEGLRLLKNDLTVA